MQPNWESEWPEDAIGSFVSMVASFTTTAKKINLRMDGTKEDPSALGLNG